MFFVVIKDKKYENKGSDWALWWKAAMTMEWWCYRSHLVVYWFPPSVSSMSWQICLTAGQHTRRRKQDTAENIEPKHVPASHQNQPWYFSLAATSKITQTPFTRPAYECRFLSVWLFGKHSSCQARLKVKWQIHFDYVCGTGYQDESTSTESVQAHGREWENMMLQCVYIFNIQMNDKLKERPE